MSDNEIDKSSISTKRARESSMEDEEEGRALKIDPKNQVKMITQLQQDHLLDGQTWYLISKSWFTRWKQYCSRLSSPQQDARKIGEQTNPGPINNQSILQSDGTLMDSLILDESVFAVPEAAWKDLAEWYGVNSEPIERLVIKKSDGSLTVELYPPIFKLFVVSDVTLASFDRSPRFTFSETSTISDLLLTIRESLDLSQNAELQIWLLSDEPNSPTIASSSLQNATLIDTKNQSVTLSRSGQFNIAVVIKGDARFPTETFIKHSDSSSISSTSSIFANGFNSLAASSAESTPTSALYPKFTRGVCGLHNLGNTCFMNSALQCLSNTPNLTKWFLAENHKKELNRDNPLGMNGQVAESYGELIEKLWNGNAQSYTPRDFKYTIGKFNSSFYGYHQNDTQELLAFLLDGLHEDLNRIIKKPYIELPDFDGMKDKEIAERSWNYHRARNDSVIVDLFQGQFKSTLICAECKNVSVTFDPFMYLSLPLPIERKCKKTVVYVPYDPTQRMQRVVLTLNKDADIAQLQKEVAKIMSVKDASTLLVVEIFSHKIYKVFSHYEAVARIGNSDLIYVYQLPGPVPSISKKKAVPYRLYNHNEDVLDTVEAEDNNQLVVFPVYCATVESHDTSSGQPQQFGNPFIVAVSRSDANNPDSLYQLLLQHVERYTHFKLFEEVDEEQTNDELPKDETVTNQAMDIDDQPQQQPIHTAAAVLAAGDKKTGSTANLFTMKVFSGPRSYGKYTEELLPCSQSWSPSSLEDLRERAEEEQRRREEYERQQNEPSEEEVENNDVEMKESTVLDSKTQGDTDDEDEVENAAAIFYQREPNAFAIDDDTVVSDHNSSFSNKNNTNSKQESPVLSAAHAYTTPPQTSEEALGPKTIPVKRKLTCPPSTIIRQGEGILLEWNPKKAQQLFGKAPFISVSGISASGWDDIEELGDPDNIYINQADQKKKQLTLSDCLDEFTKEEELSEEDLWYCPKCKKHQMATKKFDLWHMPEILVVHLKRFSHSRTWRDKIDTLIDFPIEELDLTYRVLSVDKETVNEENRLIYDLYAVDNHYGGLGGGHYTAYAQNFEDKNWYHFDDSHVSKIDVADIKTSAAYLLFYKRRRNQGQDVAKTVDEIIQEKNEKQQAAEVKESHESDEMSDDINMLTSKQMSDDENRNDEFKEKKQFV